MLTLVMPYRELDCFDLKGGLLFMPVVLSLGMIKVPFTGKENRHVLSLILGIPKPWLD